MSLYECQTTYSSSLCLFFSLSFSFLTLYFPLFFPLIFSAVGFPFRIVQLGPLSFCFSGLNLPVLHFSPGFLFRRSAWASLFLFVWVIPLSPVSCSWIFVLCSAWASVCLFVWVNPLCPVFCSWIFCSVGHFEGAVCLCCWVNYLFTVSFAHGFSVPYRSV